MKQLFPPFHGPNAEKSMIFVDGENLAIRYGKELTARGLKPIDGISYRQNVYVWPNRFYDFLITRTRLIRLHYYTCVQGDAQLIEQITDELQAINIQSPFVFQKKPNGRSKQVDISLTTNMLMHGSLHNYDLAVLVSGDEDYVPLVEAVKAQGCRVVVWFISNGLSPVLRRSADLFVNIDDYLFKPIPKTI